MFDAQTLNLPAGVATPSTVVYSPWFPRGGDYGIFTMEVIKMSETGGVVTLKAKFFTKSSSTPGDGTSVGAFDVTIASNASYRQSEDVTTGFNELVRYEFTLSATGTPTTPHWATFRMLAPVWYDKV